MRDYGKVSPQFWTGKTGKALRGDLEAQVVAMYLMTSPHANMIGVYHLPMLYLSHETGLSIEGASKGLAKCVELGFCVYDDESETVFVVEMAAHQVGEELKESDNRVKSVVRQFKAISSPLIADAFHVRYGEPFNLESPSKAPTKGPAKGLPKPPIPAPVTDPVPAKSGKTQKTAIPADFAVSERVARWAEEKGHSRIQERFEHFVGAAKARGYVYADWDEALMTAIRSDWAEFGKPGAPAKRRQQL